MYAVLKSEVFITAACVVRREGNSFTLFVCPHLGGGRGGSATGGRGGSGGGVGQPGGEGWVSRGEGGSVGGRGGSATGGGVGQVQLLGGWVRSSCRGGGSGPAAGGGWVRSSRGGGSGPAGGGGSAKIEQHREYLLHGRGYASCVHAGGLSCCYLISF